MARSLRSRLLAWVMLPMLGAVAVDAWIGHREASATASVVQDRLLLGAARIVAEQLHPEDGVFQTHIPPAALELFEAGEVDRVYYRVTTASGQLVTGYAELELPAAALQPETPLFVDTTVRGTPVRAVAYLQPVVGSRETPTVLVQMAQTMNGHAALTRRLWLRAVGQQVLLLGLVAALVLFGLKQGLRPLLRLRDTVAAREPASLQPLQAAQTPPELSPLVEAINAYAHRLDRYAGAQRVFVQNAAHQLRTPLTVLGTQVSYALSSPEGAGRDETLAAIRGTVHHASRLVNQLLTLSAMEAQGAPAPDPAPLALDEVVREVLEALAVQADAKDIDLGFEGPGGPAPRILGQRLAVREIVMNLVDNALRYTPRGGRVTTRIEAAPEGVRLLVEDNGPGIAPADRERAFQRFQRLHDGDSQGSGLGLPIVREFAERLSARVELQTSAGGQGLTVVVQFVAAPGT